MIAFVAGLPLGTAGARYARRARAKDNEKNKMVPAPPVPTVRPRLSGKRSLALRETERNTQ